MNIPIRAGKRLSGLRDMSGLKELAALVLGVMLFSPSSFPALHMYVLFSLCIYILVESLIDTITAGYSKMISRIIHYATIFICMTSISTHLTVSPALALFYVTVLILAGLSLYREVMSGG